MEPKIKKANREAKLASRRNAMKVSGRSVFILQKLAATPPHRPKKNAARRQNAARRRTPSHGPLA